jgi:hypothetical protein
MTIQELLEYVDFDYEGFYADEIETLKRSENKKQVIRVDGVLRTFTEIYYSFYERLLSKYRADSEETKLNLRVSFLKHIIIKKTLPYDTLSAAESPSHRTEQPSDQHMQKPKRLKDVIL